MGLEGGALSGHSLLRGRREELESGPEPGCAKPGARI